MELKKVYLVLSTESARYEKKFTERPEKIDDNDKISIPDSFMMRTINSYNFEFMIAKKCRSRKQTIIVKSARGNWKQREILREQLQNLEIDADIYFLLGEAKFDQNEFLWSLQTITPIIFLKNDQIREFSETIDTEIWSLIWTTFFVETYI